jgi:MFS family permease
VVSALCIQVWTSLGISPGSVPVLIHIIAGSQIPLYFVGACLEFIARDLGAVTNSSWLPVANTLAIAAVAPACGYLEDIFGRRLITLVGGLLISVGCIIMATAHTFGQGVVAMAIAGAGASIGELSALSGYAFSGL